MLNVSTECIHGSCALSTQLRVQGDGLVKLMPEYVCHVKDANVEAILSNCELSKCCHYVVHTLTNELLNTEGILLQLLILFCIHHTELFFEYLK